MLRSASNVSLSCTTTEKRTKMLHYASQNNDRTGDVIWVFFLSITGEKKSVKFTAIVCLTGYHTKMGIYFACLPLYFCNNSLVNDEE
jgi:hypothetical protein